MTIYCKLGIRDFEMDKNINLCIDCLLMYLTLLIEQIPVCMFEKEGRLFTQTAVFWRPFHLFPSCSHWRMSDWNWNFLNGMSCCQNFHWNYYWMKRRIQTYCGSVMNWKMLEDFLYKSTSRTEIRSIKYKVASVALNTCMYYDHEK